MELFKTISFYIILLGGWLCFFKACEQIIIKKPTRNNILLFFLLLVTSFVHTSFGLLAINFQDIYTVKVFLFVMALFFTSLFLLGPLILFYYHSIIDSSRSTSNKDIFHLIPAGVIFIFLLYYLYTLSPELQRAVKINTFYAPLGNVIEFLAFSAFIYIVGYILYLLKVELSVLKSKKIIIEILLLLILTIVTIISMSIIAAGYFLSNMELYLSGCILLTATHIYLFIIQNRYSDFFQKISREIKRIKYEKCLLKGMNTELINERLCDLMDDEKLYSDFDINLKKIAERLSITSHQLSQFLNERLNIDFRNYINKYRLEDAKKLLVDEPERTILNICYKVGFGSKAAFYNAFKGHTGMTPTGFREKYI